MELLNRFVRFNKRVCDSLTPPRCEPLRLHRRFDQVVAEIASTETGRVFLDVGAGKRCFYSDHITDRRGHRFIGVDESVDEMADNAFLDERIVADVCKGLGLPPGSVDCIVGRSVVEHLEDTEAFLRNAFRTLKPGGKMVLVFPGRYATFALIKRMLPARAASSVLTHLMPGSEGILGFTTHYDRATHSEFTRSLERAGFRVERCELHYFSSGYFGFFIPLFLLNFAVDHVRSWAGLKDLASYYLFVASKPDGEAAPPGTDRRRGGAGRDQGAAAAADSPGTGVLQPESS